MIIYPYEKIPQNFLIIDKTKDITINFKHFEDDNGLFISADELPVEVAMMKLSELNPSEYLIQVLNDLDVEYIGECTIELAEKIGIGCMIEISEIIKEEITKYNEEHATARQVIFTLAFSE